VTPTFLLLHGIGLSHRAFIGLESQLSRHGRVINFDLPGFGSTPRPSHRMSVEDYAAAIRRELQTRDAGPVVVVGHSMGAQFAVELARQDPDAVTHVVLVGPVVDEKKRSLISQGLVLLRDSALEPPATQLMVVREYFRCGPRWYFTEASAMLAYPTHLAIEDVRHPVLIVRGQNDPIADAPWCQSLSERARYGSVVHIPKNRHNVVHANPAATAAAIVEFATVTRTSQQSPR
jgi:pimeloyl-ACP methyl ester carboxylesterase